MHLRLARMGKIGYKGRMKRLISSLALGLGLAMSAMPLAHAQDALELPVVQEVLDYREEMRRYIQDISDYARSLNPNISIVTDGGTMLLGKIDFEDETKTWPARTYMRSLDGVLARNLFVDANGEYTDEERSAHLKMLEQARAYGLKVMTLDVADKAATINDTISAAAKHGFVPYVAPTALMNSQAAYPKAPVNENPNTVTTLRGAENFLYLDDTFPLGDANQMVLKLRENNYDLVVVDVFHGRQPINKAQVDALKFKKLGTKRLVFAHIDVGSAASYRYYWKEAWNTMPPLWLDRAYPFEPDRFFVQFWNPEWKSLIFGNENSYVYGVIAQGFDGIILSGLENFLFFETAGENLEQ